MYKDLLECLNGLNSVYDGYEANFTKVRQSLPSLSPKIDFRSRHLGSHHLSARALVSQLFTPKVAYSEHCRKRIQVYFCNIADNEAPALQE